MRFAWSAALLVTLAWPALAETESAGESTPAHGLAMHGDLKYGRDFKHLDYVVPSAPKGGTMNNWALGAFDSFNPFIVKGETAAGVSLIYDSLMMHTADEPFSVYGLLAESIETPPDRSWVTFRLRPEARWHDGMPVTADDVIWTFETLRSKGQPHYRAYYAGVERTERIDERTVKFAFKPGVNRELPLILGDLNVLPKHYWESREFDKTSLDPPLGSGPYRVARFEAGRFVEYERVPDYWGAELPINAGRWNFDRIVFTYFRDSNVATEAFKAGTYDYRLENASKTWATQYDIPAVKDGRIVKRTAPHDRPQGMQAFAFNARRSMFQDPLVRQALGLAFDFEWSNKNLFHGQYTRNRSYFDNSELAATGVPSGAELALLEPFRDRLPAEVFTREYNPPTTDGSGRNRENLRQAVELLAKAGWTIDKATKLLAHAQHGPMRFEALLYDPQFERIVLPFKKNLERLGITVEVRVVDTAQYTRRLDDFDFDMVVVRFPVTSSPGNELRGYWGSEFADQKGSSNVIGIEDPVVDSLIEAIIAAPDRQALVARVRALDRVLQWGHWVIPHYYIAYDRLAYWNKFGMPEVIPDQGVQVLDTWWVDPDKAATLKQAKE
jgi:microcin C transport system substrate-binding protein